MNRLLGFAAGALLMMAGQPAFADTIFSDTFTRANSGTVGNGWLEAGGDISVNNNELLFDSNDNTITATQGTLVVSTVGFTNLVFSFDWRGISSDTGESISAYWSADGTTFNFLGSNLLAASASFANQSYNLPGGAQGLADITLRFIVDLDDGNSAARIDNVLLTGTAVASVPGPIVGAGLPGLMIAFGGFLAWRRRRQQASSNAV